MCSCWNAARNGEDDAAEWTTWIEKESVRQVGVSQNKGGGFGWKLHELRDFVVGRVWEIFYQL